MKNLSVSDIKFLYHVMDDITKNEFSIIVNCEFDFIKLLKYKLSGKALSLLVKLGASEEDCLSYLRPLYANFLLQPKLPYCSYKGKSLEWHPYSGKKPEFEDKIKSLCWLAAATIYRHQKTLPIQKLNTQCQNIVLAYENAQQNPQGIIKRRF